MFEVWVDNTRWLTFSSVSDCKNMMNTYDPDGTVLMLIRDVERDRFLTHEEIWGGTGFVVTASEPKCHKTNWPLEGF
jgi:hypothetical protein